MSDVSHERWSLPTGMVLFGVILLLVAGDVVADARSGTHWLHIAIELVILLFAAIGIAVLWVRYLGTRRDAELLQRDLEAARADARHWRNESREALAGLGAAIDRQFERWELSPAEAEIGLLLLKGLTHKEIARVRSTSERTVRQQARALYLKARLAGRAELSAFFLEDLLLPRAIPEPPERA